MSVYKYIRLKHEKRFNEIKLKLIFFATIAHTILQRGAAFILRLMLLLTK